MSAPAIAHSATPCAGAGPAAVQRSGRVASRPLAEVTVRIAGRDVLNVRRALARSGAPCVRIAQCTALPHGGRCQLRVQCEARWTGVVMRCVMQQVSAAEFGRCTPV
jgi:hypothetical protein